MASLSLTLWFQPKKHQWVSWTPVPCKFPVWDDTHSALVWVFLLWRYHDYNNFYEEKYLIRAGLQSQRFSPLISWWEACWDARRQCWRRSSEFCILIYRLQKGTVLHWAEHLSKVHPRSDTLPPTRPYLLIVPLPKAKHSNTWICGGQTYSNHHTQQLGRI